MPAPSEGSGADSGAADTHDRLRSAPGLEGVRIVGITGFGDEQHRREAEEAGFDGLLTKPLRLADLERVLAGQPNAAAAT